MKDDKPQHGRGKGAKGDKLPHHDGKGKPPQKKNNLKNGKKEHYIVSFTMGTMGLRTVQRRRPSMLCSASLGRNNNSCHQLKPLTWVVFNSSTR